MNIIDTYYLIDYENVGSEGLSGCSTLGKEDHIMIFFTKNAKRIDMSEIANHGDAELHMIEVPAGKQSADIHIGSYLGFLAGKNEDSECSVIIISKDTDYDNVIRFWSAKTGIKASRAQKIRTGNSKTSSSKGSVKTAPKAPPKQPKQKKSLLSKVSGKKKMKLNQEIMQAVRLAGYDAEVANTVAQLTTGHYGEAEMMTEVHNALREKYTDYLDVYVAIKPVLSRYVPAPAPKKKTPAEPKKKTSAEPGSSEDRNRVNTEVMRTLSQAGYSSDIATNTASLVVKNLGIKNGKQKTYRTIISEYGQGSGLAIYNHIKKYTLSESERNRKS